MNSKRAVGWVAFLGVAAALTWLPEYFKPADDSDLEVAAVATPAKGKNRGALPAAHASAAPVAIKDLSPAGDLFAARSWKAAPTLASVTEQPGQRRAGGAGPHCTAHAVPVHRPDG